MTERDRMKRLLAIALLVAGCSSAGGYVPPAPTDTRTPWPDRFQTGVCLALFDLSGMSDNLQQIADAASAFDVATVESEAAKMNDGAKLAANHLSLIDPWAPGATLISHLSTAAVGFRKAANLTIIGVKASDAASITAGLKQLKTALAVYSKGKADLTELSASTGFTCPF